ncbi:MAG: protein kinase domain-containing protein, partial [Planctomycetota bacterium]
MAKERHCNECGSEMAPDAPQGLCPQCLMKLGLEGDADITFGDADPVATSGGPGTVIGRYKLLDEIGEGGMAIVYMAEQSEHIHRKVALKIIKLGMDTKQVIARFEAERQVLAMMDHPNVAKVLDAGATDTGRPYFVMELV